MVKEKLAKLYDASNQKFYAQFGFKIEDVTFDKIVAYMHVPKDSSSLAITRILFGLAMLFDIPDERGGATMEKRWGDPQTCHFPLLPFIQPVPMPYMAAVYAGLWFGALGITLGYKYRHSVLTFTVCYWYLFLVEKSYWNNHSYLFGLVALLLSFTDASCYWSIDAYLDSSKSKTEVPYWNYFILKYQFFILYFMAGMKKGTAEWLSGYSVQNLSEHWVFQPFKIFLTVPQTDYLIVHWFVFIFDLTVAVWMMVASTRNVAMIFCAMFHLMNTRLFRIGMFPWVCLATMPLFYPFDWPKTLPEKLMKMKFSFCKQMSKLKTQECDCQQEKEKSIDVNDDGYKGDSMVNSRTNEKDTFDNVYRKEANINEPDDHIDEKHSDIDETIEDKNNTDSKEVGEETTKMNNKENNHVIKPNQEYSRKKITVYLIILYMLSQAFLPYSHFITQVSHHGMASNLALRPYSKLRGAEQDPVPAAVNGHDLGYNNWTNGLYGYSWDMMVHTWDTHAVIVRIVDNERHKDFYIEPYTYSPNDRWTRHGDMLHQYARCLRDNLMEDAERFKVNNERVISDNISIYIDVWCSMNGRFTQRIFDPKVDLLKAEWRPFVKISYLMPLLDEALDWRTDLEVIKKEVYSWNNYSDVIFLADFPGYEQEKYISEDLKNVTLTSLDGVVAYHPEVSKFLNGYSVQLAAGNHTPVDSGMFHKVLNIGQSPAFYMYTFYTSTEVEFDMKKAPKSEVVTELYIRFYNMLTFFNIMSKNLVQIFFTKCELISEINH